MPLKDTDPFPIGRKYKGTRMIDVPASYLLWFEGEVKHAAPNKRSLAERLILEYIDENKEVLLKEMKDGKTS